MFKIISTLSFLLSLAVTQTQVPQITQSLQPSPQTSPLTIQKSAEIARRLKTLNTSLETMPSSAAMTALQNFKTETGIIPNVSPSIVQRLLADNFKSQLCELFRVPDKNFMDYTKLVNASLFAATGVGLALKRNAYTNRIIEARDRYNKLLTVNKKNAGDVKGMTKSLEDLAEDHEKEFDRFEQDISIRINRLKSTVEYKFRMDGTQEGDVLDVIQEVDEDDEKDDDKDDS